tara:strand:- start:580 stop:693 length:114 start_codon:yes stop_codon:yes gene_type:complete
MVLVNFKNNISGDFEVRSIDNFLKIKFQKLNNLRFGN